jgi:hypothetical protein
MAEELSCLRCHRRPGNITEVRRPRLYKGKRFILEIISSRIESLILRQFEADDPPRSCSDRPHLQGEQV